MTVLSVDDFSLFPVPKNYVAIITSDDQNLIVNFFNAQNGKLTSIYFGLVVFIFLLNIPQSDRAVVR
jgi:hypothetical protein